MAVGGCRARPARSLLLGFHLLARRSLQCPERIAGSVQTHTSPAYPEVGHGRARLAVPYTLELNDIPMMVIQHHTWNAWAQRPRSVRPALRGGGSAARLMALAVDPYISRVPHRIKHLEAVYDYMRKHKGVWL